MDERTAAAYLGLGLSALRALLRRMGLKPLELGPRSRRWRRSDLDEMIARLPLTRKALFGDSCAEDETGVDLALAAVERRLQRLQRPRKPH
jgi:hypothetical protein